MKRAVLRLAKNTVKFGKSRIYPSYPLLYLATFGKLDSRLRFKNERQVLKGKNITSGSRKSILFFTVHKCASVYISKIIKRFGSEKGLVHLDFDAFFSAQGKKAEPAFKDEVFLEQAFLPAGYYYGAMRSYRAIPQMSAYHVILVLRDPRDVLTSYYYSTAFSHRVVTRNTLSRRREALKRSIDEYVLQESVLYKARYEEYLEMLMPASNLLFLRYEDMVMDFPAWLEKMAVYLDMQEASALKQQFLNEANFSPREDMSQHKRKVTPGDHRAKLKAETIARLNSDFASTLGALGYE